MAHYDSAPVSIGERARWIRMRRGLSLKVAADLAGISKGYLSMLENGERRFEKRGLLENVARALGCSPADLTGQTYLPPDLDSATALGALPSISVALYDATLNDVPDLPARPVDELVRWASTANEHTAHSRYAQAGRDLDTLLTELHILAVTGDSDTSRQALAALVEACFAASSVARNLGSSDLAVHAAHRAQEAASRLAGPADRAFAAMTSTSALSRLGARRRAQRLATDALGDIGAYADPTATDTAAAEAAGMLHLSSAQMAAKDHRPDLAEEHLVAARDFAEYTGERNRLWFSFGPANVRAWSLSIAVELGRGPETAELVERTPGYDVGLVSADRRAALHFDLARGYAQAQGQQDWAAIRHLDRADRIAPQRIRHDPIARELVSALNVRAQRTTWELGSLRNRFGL